jgi:glycosyltransferase involved in cell wall biosynthesis
MNILIINHYAGSLKNGFEYRPYYFAREFLKRGHNVFIVCSSYSHLRQNDPDVKIKLSEEIIDGIKYYWIRTPKYSDNGIKRVINIFSFILAIYLYKRKFVKLSPDAVIASSTYPLDIYPAYKIAKLSGAKLIFEVHDLWPLTPIELGGMNKNNPFIKFLQNAENFAYQKADKVISILPKTKNYMIDHGMQPEKFHFIPNGVDFSEWEKVEDIPEEHKKIINVLKSENKFLIGYAGSIGLANALEYLIDSANLLKEKPIAFIVVGNGPDKNKLQERSKGFKNVYFLPQIPKKSIACFLGMMDVLYIGFRDKPIYRFGVGTNKLYDYMMAGKPIVQSQKAGNDLVKENNCGISVLPENPKLIAEAVTTLFNMSAIERQVLGNNGKEYVVKNHNFSFLAGEFLNAIN